MTSTVTRSYTILNTEFEVDELKDIVTHGMSAGVSGFIYTRDCVDKFNEHDDEIEEYLSDWYHDTMGENNYIGAIASSGDYPVCSIDALKNRMVWAYVELKAFEILSENGYDFWVSLGDDYRRHSSLHLAITLCWFSVGHYTLRSLTIFQHVPVCF